MKNVITLIIGLFISFSNYAQDPQLFENDWYLTEIVIDDLHYIPPNVEGELRVGKIYFYEVKVDINYCSFTEALIEYDPITNVFILEDFPGIIPAECLNSDNIEFGNLYFNVFFNQEHLAKNPFSYTIEDVLISKWLTITNLNGDQAIYHGESLSNQDFDSSSFTLYPNPATHVITIESASQNSINRILIYDTLGRLVLEQKKITNQIDISTLDSGLLFITIETDKGVFAKKIIKQ